MSEGKKQHRLLPLFLIYMIAIILCVFLAVFFKNTKVYATVFYFIIIAGITGYLRTENFDWHPWLAKPQPGSMKRIVVFTLSILFMTLFVVVIRTAVWIEGITEVFAFDIFACIATCLLAPLTEEFVCRGIIIDILKEKHKPAFTILVSAFLFYIIHGNLMNVGAFLFGIFAGWTVLKSRSVLPGMLIHFVWNTVIYFLPAIAKNLSLYLTNVS